MKFLLDTNICSYIIKNKPKKIHEKFMSISPDDCAISSISLAELHFWISKNKLMHIKSNNQGTPSINEQVINNFIRHLNIMDFDSLAAKSYGDLRAYLELKGNLIGSEDLFIGAHALSLNCILVTNNVREFQRIPNLKIENWI